MTVAVGLSICSIRNLSAGIEKYGFARETTFIENVALQGNPFASQVGHAAPDSSEAIHTQEAAA
jgi:hypothetical protein